MTKLVRFCQDVANMLSGFYHTLRGWNTSVTHDYESIQISRGDRLGWRWAKT